MQAELPLASTALQQAFSGQLTASATISAVSAGCNTVDSSITAIAVGLPADFVSATVYCGVAPAQSVQFWGGLLQVVACVSCCCNIGIRPLPDVWCHLLVAC